MALDPNSPFVTERQPAEAVVPVTLSANRDQKVGDGGFAKAVWIAGVGDADSDSIPVTTQNITTKFREAFEDLSVDHWTTVVGAGDIVQVDGNAAAASYLSISKSPWDAGTETSLETVATFEMPVEIAVGAHRSQATLGQEFSLEFVDTDAPLPPVSDLAISSITQTASVLTVDTVQNHGLVPGKSIGIVGCSNPLANYPALVVATIPGPRQFTVTAGPGGTIPSQTITNPVGAKGSVYFRERLGRAKDGISLIFENPTATNASFYLRSESGDALPSGTITGNHAITVGTTASVQLVNAAYTYAFSPTTEYRMVPQADRVQMSDVAVDALVQASNRVLRTQVCPDPSATYRFRIRATNNKALTVLTAKVVSVSKPGTTVGTFTTATPHGLVTGDSIVYYGNSNVAASAFPNLTTATAVTVLTPTTFTVAAIGTAATVTGYGGVISKAQGGNLLSALGVFNNSGVNATLSTLADGTRQLVLTGAASWSATIGDYVNVEGVTNATNGATLGVDGAWKVANSVTTALTLVPCTAAFAATLPADFVLTNSAGAVIKRTCLRLSYVRIFDYERQRVEMLPRPAGDIAGGAPVVVQNTVPVSGTVGVSGTVAATQSGAWSATLLAGAVTIGNANQAPATQVADVASAAITSTATVAAITPGFGVAYQVNIPVTAVTGTNPTMDVRIEESDDGGTNWFTVYDFPRITATGIYRSPFLPVNGNRVRYVQTIGGTTPSFTRAINRIQSNGPVLPSRQLIDRTVVPNTLSSVTPVLLTRDCGNSTQLVVNMGAGGTPPSFQVEGSDDFGATWYAIGSPLAAVAAFTVQVTVSGINAGAIRARVLTAGSGSTLGWVALKAHD
jgi:hypothetical protein